MQNKFGGIYIISTIKTLNTILRVMDTQDDKYSGQYFEQQVRRIKILLA